MTTRDPSSRGRLNDSMLVRDVDALPGRAWHSAGGFACERRRTAGAVARLCFVLFVGMGGIYSDYSYSVALEPQNRAPGPRRYTPWESTTENQKPDGWAKMLVWCAAAAIVLAAVGIAYNHFVVRSKKKKFGAASVPLGGISKKMDAKWGSPSSRFGGKPGEPQRGLSGGPQAGAIPWTRNDAPGVALGKTIRDILAEVLPGVVRQCRADVTFAPETAEGIADMINRASLAETDRLRGELDASRTTWAEKESRLTTEMTTIEGNLAEMTVKRDICEKRLENLAKIVPQDIEEFLAQPQVLPLSGSPAPESLGAVLALICLHQAAAGDSAIEKKKDDVRECFMRLDDLLYRSLATQPEHLESIRQELSPKVNAWMAGTYQAEWPKPGDKFNQETQRAEGAAGITIRIARTAILQTPEGQLVRPALVETE